jgi:hypothetical protein
VSAIRKERLSQEGPCVAVAFVWLLASIAWRVTINVCQKPFGDLTYLVSAILMQREFVHLMAQVL